MVFWLAYRNFWIINGFLFLKKDAATLLFVCFIDGLCEKSFQFFNFLYFLWAKSVIGLMRELSPHFAGHTVLKIALTFELKQILFLDILFYGLIDNLEVVFIVEVACLSFQVDQVVIIEAAEKMV